MWLLFLFFILLNQSLGHVLDWNAQESITNSIGFGILGAFLSYLGVPSIPAAIGATSGSIVATIYGQYQGNYYKSETYVSGRCMKTIITTYEDRNYTEYVKTYTSWMKW